MSKKWVLIPLFALTFLAVGSHLFFQSGYVSAKTRHFAETRIATLLDRKVQIRSAHINLFSASVFLEGISVESRESGSPSELLAEGVRIAFSPWSLFMEAFMIGEVTIDSPVLVLSEQALNEVKFALTSSDSREGDVSTKVVVRTILVRNGRVSYQGGKAVKTISLENLDLKVDPNLKMDQFEIALSGKEGVISTDKGDGRLDRFDVKLVVHPDRIHLEKAWLTSRQMTLLTEGVFYLNRENPLDFRFDAKMPVSHIDVASSGESGDVILGGRILSGEAVLIGHLSGSLSNPNIKGKTILAPLFLEGKQIGTLEADIDYQDGSIIIDSVTGEIFSGSVSGSGRAHLSFISNSKKETDETLGYQINLKYEGFSLHRIIQGIQVNGVDEDRLFEGIFLDGDMVLSGRKFDGENITAEGHFKAKRHPLFSPALPMKAKRLTNLMALFSKGNTTWRWSEGNLVLDQGEINLPDTKIVFHGEWNKEDGFALKTSIQSEEVRELADSLRLPLTGHIKVEGVLEGRIDHPTFEGDVLLEKWTLRNQSFGALSSHFSYASKTVSFKQGILMGPDSNHSSNAVKEKRKKRDAPRYRFEGDVGFEDFPIPSFDLRADAISADPLEILTLFKRPIPLHTEATGRLFIKGTPKSLTVQGPLVVSKGVLYGESFDRGKLDLTVTEKEVRFRNVVLEKKLSRLVGEGEVGYRGAYRLALRGRRLQVHKTSFFQSRVPFLGGEVGLKVSGKGSFKKPELNVHIDIKDLHYGELTGGSGNLTIHWNNREIKMEGKLPDKNFSLLGEVALTEAYPFSFKSHFDTLQLAPFLRAHLTGLISDVGIQLTGKMEGQGELSHLDRVNLDGSFSKVAADFSGYSIRNDGVIMVHSEGGNFLIKDSRFKGENTSLVFNGNMALQRSWDLLMEGEADLNLIKFFTKEISSGSGKAVLNLRVSDHWKNPLINGVLHLKNGKIRTVSFSRTILIDSLEVVFNQDRLVLDTFEGKIGGGRFHGSGKALISGLSLKSFGFLLALEDAGVNILPKLLATVDGELFFQRNEKGQSLKGELKLKRAVYEKRTDIKSFITKLNKNKGQALWSNAPISGRTELNVHLYGREGVRINNNLAKIPLSIDLFLKGTNEKPLLLGRVDLPRGKIFLRRNHFRVVSGSVDFLNPEKIDPTFDIHAKTDVRNYATDQTYKVELTLRGTLSQITLILSSSPSLPEADILALLTLGKTTADIAEGGAGGEATAFVVSELLEEPVQKVTGVDRIQVNPTVGESNGSKSTNGTRFTAEKRLLEDRLIVVYSTTLDPSEEDLIRMVYEVNKNISLVGNRDDRGQIGGDIRFRFEFR